MKTEVRDAIDAEILNIVDNAELTPEQYAAFFLAPAHQKLLNVLDAMPDDYATPTVYGVRWGGIFRPIQYVCSTDLAELVLEFSDTEIVVMNTDKTVLPYNAVVTIEVELDRAWFISNAPGLQIQPVVEEPEVPVDPEPEVPVDPA